MYRIALKLTGNSDNASDIVQEVFICLFDKLRNGNEILYPAAWLYKAVVNKCCDSIRRQKRFGSLELIKNFEAEEELEIIETTAAIRLALSQLKPQERIIITLYSEGLSYKEIAGASGVRLSSIGKTLSRILEKLEKKLKNIDHDMYKKGFDSKIYR